MTDFIPPVSDMDDSPEIAGQVAYECIGWTLGLVAWLALLAQITGGNDLPAAHPAAIGAASVIIETFE